MKQMTLFYAGLLYDEYDTLEALRPHLHTLPDGVYLYSRRWPDVNGDRRWFNKDLIHIPIEEVPKELRVLVLLMS